MRALAQIAGALFLQLCQCIFACVHQNGCSKLLLVTSVCLLYDSRHKEKAVLSYCAEKSAPCKFVCIWKMRQKAACQVIMYETEGALDPLKIPKVHLDAFGAK